MLTTLPRHLIVMLTLTLFINAVLTAQAMWNRIRSEDDNETKRLWSFRHKLFEKYEVGMTYAYVICIPILSFDSTPKKFPCLPTYVTALIVTYRHCTLYDYVVIC